MTSWSDFAAAEPELSAFVAERLQAAPAYLATLRPNGAPRVHPVTPIFTAEGLYLFMEPTSPKVADLRDRARFALHNGVPDNAGTGGEAWVSGSGHLVEDATARAAVAAVASYDPADRYLLVELRPSEVRCNGYGDVTLPERRGWRAEPVVMGSGASGRARNFAVRTPGRSPWHRRPPSSIPMSAPGVNQTRGVWTRDQPEQGDSNGSPSVRHRQPRDQSRPPGLNSFHYILGFSRREPQDSGTTS